ncbi:hypothetical protein HUN59_14495 [Curtobacterium sp. Csp2]|uniref:hypothetical protein n=1 Tax=Curtobacterium sp. Csp2 TaxID=2495430 RepID=UPI00158006D7|nr:hypothetical protein [Curtobacterium sp. Csp2]QKS17252.1 hypothetical protein HUN59_14495 [Curtobacterium sp. Csp2]
MQFDTSYWQSALDVTRTNWEGRREAVRRATGPHDRRSALRGSWHQGLRYLGAQYSAGRTLDEVGTVVADVASSYAEWTACMPEAGAATPSFAKSNEYLISVLRLVGLAMGTGRVESAQLVLSHAGGHEPEALISALAVMHCAPVLETGAAVPPTPRFARPLLRVLERPGAAADHVSTYLADWHLRMQATDWMGSLERVAPGDSYGQGFFGYWAFELAALNAEGERAAAAVRSPVVPVDLLDDRTRR